MSNLTIVMYHYVRPIEGSTYSGIKGLEVEGFRRQLGYFSEHFNVVSTAQVIDATRNSTPLPSDACWLTFDDGYKDHFNYVLPELLERGLHGAFFPPRVAIEEEIVLGVNLIHHTLSCASDIRDVVLALNDYCLFAGMSNRDISALYFEHAVPTRFDNGDTMYVKRMLQHVLPEPLRTTTAEKLFSEFVGLRPAELSRELYMSVSEVRELVKHGMHVGSHGSRHYWLDKVSRDEQAKDIGESLRFLEGVGASLSDWIMCYPYGAYNDSTLSLLRHFNAALGITTEARVANLDSDNPFTLPRLDTNDFPQ